MTLLRDERALLEAFRAGDRQALERVYWHYVTVVVNVVRQGVVFANGGRVQGVPPQDVADLVQEVFTRAFRDKARQAYDGVREYRPYLLTICRNLLADWSRQRGREIPTELDLDQEAVVMDAPEAWSHPAASAVVREYAASLQGVTKDVYVQRFECGRSQAAASQALGIGRQRLRTIERDLRRGLAQALQAAEIEQL